MTQLNTINLLILKVVDLLQLCVVFYVDGGFPLSHVDSGLFVISVAYQMNLLSVGSLPPLDTLDLVLQTEH